MKSRYGGIAARGSNIERSDKPWGKGHAALGAWTRGGVGLATSCWSPCGLDGRSAAAWLECKRWITALASTTASTEEEGTRGTDFALVLVGA